MKKYQVWIEATGPSTGTEGCNTTGAGLMGEAEANDFDQAIQIVCMNPPHEGKRFLHRGTDGHWRYYGARMYETEAEALVAWNSEDKRPSAKEE